MCDISNPIYHNAEAAREHLESIRWPNGPVCGHCGSQNVYRMRGKATRSGLLKCRDCRKQFSVTIGTVFERSKVPLNKWIYATHMMASSKKGVSAHQIHRTVGVTYKTAWFMMHRLREAMRDTSNDQLGGAGTSGIVEVDEAYIGPRTRGKGKGNHKGKKQQIVALVEREGRVRAYHVPSVTVENVESILKGQVDPNARLMTDGAGLYTKMGASFASHETVNHVEGEYVRGDVTTNTVEGYFGIFKRGLRGVYQHCAPIHLYRYLDEFSFRYNYRASLEINDVQRADILLKGAEGKRLMYRRPVEAHAEASI